ncbi:hypothetical protein [Aquitalea sp. ASV11]|uniref:hypothetical protein n=1 Tax=Aquitalea sp. ASV11 TaxID=2795103 RepID=UPI0018EAE803|nr:hypothetical protein [Aquitalea sp. ASV11]
MTKFASKSTCGFYTAEIHGSNMPDDVVEITDEQHAYLMDGQSSGKLIDWTGGMPVLVDSAPRTAVERRAQRLSEVNAYAAIRLGKLSAAYPEGEVQSWSQQTHEAEALTNDPTAPSPLLTSIATARGVPLSALASRVRAKVAAYAVASGQIIGQRQALVDALMAIDLQAPNAAEQIAAITWPDE